MAKGSVKLDDSGFAAALDLLPPLNVYAGRDTRHFAIVDWEPSLTSQEHAEDADINVLMSRYIKTGVLPQFADRQPFYTDATELPSFMEMQNALISAEEAFMSLPAKVRDRFNNDPAKFVEFATDKENEQELKKMGLLSPEAVERLDKAEAAKAAPPPSPALQDGPKPSGEPSKGS